jgi:hypothetical protein
VPRTCTPASAGAGTRAHRRGYALARTALVSGLVRGGGGVVALDSVSGEWVVVSRGVASCGGPNATGSTSMMSCLKVAE